MSNDWMKEFDNLTFMAPYSEEYVHRTLTSQRLKDVNLKFDKHYADKSKTRSTKTVRFDNVNEYFYYKPIN